MEHRKFLRRLDELVGELTYAQGQKVIAALQQRGDGDEVQRLLEQRLEDDPKCARCGSRRIEGWGRERNGLKRRRCLDCGRTFNPLTGTALARLWRGAQWIAAGAQGGDRVPGEQEHRLQMAPSLSESPEPIERSIAYRYSRG